MGKLVIAMYQLRPIQLYKYSIVSIRIFVKDSVYEVIVDNAGSVIRKLSIV